jgi:hypothetical protein
MTPDVGLVVDNRLSWNIVTAWQRISSLAHAP